MFVKSLNPLRWSPVRKKSEIRHALAELLAASLAAAVGCALAPADGAAARQWFDAVGTVRDDVHAWVKLKEKKHAAVGFPLVTVRALGERRCLGELGVSCAHAQPGTPHVACQHTYLLTRAPPVRLQRRDGCESDHWALATENGP